MFISSSSIIKIHQWPQLSSESDLEYVPHAEIPVKQVSLCNDNSYLAYLQGNKKSQIISLKEPSNIHLVHTITSVKNISSICFKHFTKRNLAIGTYHGEVLIYDTKLRNEIKRLAKLPSVVELLQFSNDDQQVGVCCENSIIIICNNQEDNLNEFKQTSRCTAMKFHPSISNHFVVGCLNGNVSLCDITSGVKTLNLSQHSASVTGVALCNISNMLITTGQDHKICIVDATSGKTEFKINLHQPITSVDVTNDGQFSSVGLEDGSVYIYDLRKPVVPFHNFKPHSGPVTNIVFANGTHEAFADSLEMMSNLSTLPVTEYKDNTEYFTEDSSSPCQGNEINAKDNVVKQQMLEKIKNDILRLVKVEMDDLENQLDEHCLKFQAFLNNEFDIIQNVIREKWDIFHLSDLNKSSHDNSHSNAMSSLHE